MGFALGYEGLQALLYSGHISGASGMAVQVGTGVALLLLPAFLVGCSVPLFAGYLATSDRDAGIAQLKRKGIPGFKATLQSRIRPEEVEPNLAALGPWKPARLAEEAKQRLDDDNYIARRWRALGGAAQDHYGQDLAAAKLDYWQALAAQGGTAKAHHKYGYQLLKAGRYAEAIAQFHKTLEINPRYDNAHFNLGSAYEAQNQHTLALDQYQREIAVDPEDQEALHRIGRSYVELGEYEKGLFYLNTTRYQGGAVGDLYRARALDGLGRRGSGWRAAKALSL